MRIWREDAQLRTAIPRKFKTGGPRNTPERRNRLEKRIPRQGRRGIERTATQEGGCIPPFRIFQIRLHADKFRLGHPHHCRWIRGGRGRNFLNATWQDDTPRRPRLTFGGRTTCKKGCKRRRVGRLLSGRFGLGLRRVLRRGFPGRGILSRPTICGQRWPAHAKRRAVVSVEGRGPRRPPWKGRAKPQQLTDPHLTTRVWACLRGAPPPCANLPLA